MKLNKGTCCRVVNASDPYAGDWGSNIWVVNSFCTQTVLNDFSMIELEL